MKIKYLIPCDQKEASTKIVRAVGQIKTITGAVNGCALLQMQDAFDKIKTHANYRTNTKRLFKAAMEEVKAYRQRLIHPRVDELRFFDLGDMQPEFRARFSNDLTNAEYFDFWEATGGVLYVKLAPFASALAWKFERYLRDYDKGAKALSWALVVDNMLHIAANAWEDVANESKRYMAPMVPDLLELVAPLSLRRVCDAWHRACLELLRGVPELDDMTAADVKSAITKIIDVVNEPTLYNDVMDETIREYEADVFASKGIANKLRRMNEENRAEIEEELLQERKRKMETKK